MVRLWLSFLTIMISFNLYCQTKITGTVKSSSDEKALYDAQVTLKGLGQSVQSDRIGYFQFIDVPKGAYTLEINKVGYESYTQDFVVNGEKVIDLGDLFISYDPQSVNVGVITLSTDELSSDESSTQSSVGLLQSSKDVFAKVAAYELGSFWFRPRGYDNKYSDVFFNGVRMNKIDNDRVDFGNWGGLNDITRYPAEVTYGIAPSDYAFGDLGGITYVDTRPSNLRTGNSLSYSLTNRSYRQRLMFTHNTGINAKGWGFTVSGSRRWANEGRIPGTFYDAWAYYLGIEKRFNNKHSLLLSAFGAPSRRSSSSPNTQEVYDLKGINYNAYWGYQMGDKRSERIKKTHEPLITLAHYWNITETSRLTTTLGFQFGENASGRLDWNKATNPSPTYYRNMPSYYEGTNDEKAKELAYLWKTDENFSQINWNRLYLLNNTVSGEAKYFLLSDVNQDKTFTFNTNYRNQFSDAFGLHANLSYQKTNSTLFRQLDDLLGAKYVLDVDDFADAGQSGNSDENTPNRKAYKNNRVQYNYELFVDKVDAYLAGNYKIDNFDFTLGLKLANTAIQRNGLFDYYRYTNSKGKSEKYNFMDYGVKLNATYKIDGRNYLVMNAGYFTNAPTANDVFPQQRTNNLSIPDLESAKIFSGDLSYMLRGSRIKARATGYFTDIKDEVETAFGYLERDSQDFSANLFTAEVIKGVAKQHMGAELALEAQLSTTFTVNAAAAIGQYLYKNNPDLYYFSDAYSDKGGFQYEGKTYLNKYHVAASPQKAFSVGFQYRSPKYWWVGATGNYLGDNYASLAKTRRTEAFFINKATNLPFPEAVKDLENGGEVMRALLSQEKFKDAFMLNANAGKTFRFGNYYVGLSLSVNNVLNNKNYITSGFEQLRLANFASLNDAQKRKTFGNKYWYDQGTSYFLNLFVRF
ncbi:TonB-dependent receptor [Ornithobacterium rhinotracheale]|uniref:carboxypeptidase regulatory-like domain-containing protein n=1 Tax=Ornithobacterium rhinotracheale TaxID=28251 RepID=UPI00129C9704|nr:carboxypeptidase-like regulatory domain-containing protein [Ornithobacterium rhinotracheale]MRI63700.1 TonB-dependent receptor [Ornithobacterium rhinotracheale]MRJ09602.1 TonB-dependent receptor [Ornithobacterium rhinotracheale]